MIPTLTLLATIALAQDGAPAPGTPSDPTPGQPDAPPPAPLPSPAAANAEASLTLEPDARGWAVALEGSWIDATSVGWSKLSGDEWLNGAGLKVRLPGRFGLQLGWQRATPSTDSDVELYTDDLVYDAEASYYPEDEAYLGSFDTAFGADIVTVGVRRHLAGKALEVYGALDAAVMIASIHLDTDTERQDPLGEVHRTAITGGGYGTIGVALPFELGRTVAVAPYLEVGYGGFVPAAFEDLGKLRFDGFASRLGAEVRF